MIPARRTYRSGIESKADRNCKFDAATDLALALPQWNDDFSEPGFECTVLSSSSMLMRTLQSFLVINCMISFSDTYDEFEH
jgi:hypothetical protein